MALYDQIRFADGRSEQRTAKPGTNITVNAFRVVQLFIRAHPQDSRRLEVVVESGDHANAAPPGESVVFAGRRTSVITQQDPRWDLFFADGLQQTLRDRAIKLAQSDGHLPPDEDLVEVPE